MNVLRSPISPTQSRIDNFLVGQHPHVTKLMQGILNSRPPKPRYSYTWDVKKVTAHLASLVSKSSLSLKQLLRKLVMFFALACPERTASVAKLDLRYCRVIPEGVVFSLTSPRKRGNPNQLAQAFLARFPHIYKLCPVETFLHYLKKTSSVRPTVPCSKLNPLFISYVKPHRAVSPATIERWFRPLFKGLSVRSASTTAAGSGSVSLDEIMKMAVPPPSRSSTTSQYSIQNIAKLYSINHNRVLGNLFLCIQALPFSVFGIIFSELHFLKCLLLHVSDIK